MNNTTDHQPPPGTGRPGCLFILHPSSFILLAALIAALAALTWALVSNVRLSRELQERAEAEQALLDDIQTRAAVMRGALSREKELLIRAIRRGIDDGALD